MCVRACVPVYVCVCACVCYDLVPKMWGYQRREHTQCGSVLYVNNVGACCMMICENAQAHTLALRTTHIPTHTLSHTLSHCQTVTLPHCHTVTHTVKLSHCHTVTLSHTLSNCHAHCHTATLSHTLSLPCVQHVRCAHVLRSRLINHGLSSLTHSRLSPLTHSRLSSLTLQSWLIITYTLSLPCLKHVRRAYVLRSRLITHTHIHTHTHTLSLPCFQHVRRA